MKFSLIISMIVALLISSCVSAPKARTTLEMDLPELNPAYTRIYIRSGNFKKRKLKIKTQVGPVLLNKEVIGTTAKKEYFVVDVKPGEYSLECTPSTSKKNYVNDLDVTFVAGETRYFSCNMKTKGFGFWLGPFGILLSRYLTQTFPIEETEAQLNGNLVSYSQL